MSLSPFYRAWSA